MKDEVEKNADSSKRMKFAFAGLVAFLLVYCARPNDWTGLWFFPFAKITAALAILGLLAALASGGHKFLHMPKELILLLLLFGQLCLSVPFSIWRGGSIEIVFMDFSRVIPIVILIVATATTVRRLKTLLSVQTFSIALIASLTILGISNQVNLSNNSDIIRSGGAVGGFLEDPNDFAWALALMFPLAFALMICSRKLLAKGFCIAAMLFMVIALMRTYSRSGTIAFIASAGMTIWLFGVRGRRIYLIVGAAAACLVLLVVATPEGFIQRIASTTDWSQDETGSAWARQHLFWLSVTTTLQNPLFGIGPGNFQTLPGAGWHGTHNTYTQLSSEAGIPAFLLFVALLLISVHNLNQARKWTSEKSEIWILSAGLSASFTGFIVGGMFGMAAYQFFSYFMIGYACALHKLAQEARAEGGSEKLAWNKANRTRIWPREQQKEPASTPQYSPLVRRSWRTPLGFQPERTRSGD